MAVSTGRDESLVRVRGLGTESGEIEEESTATALAGANFLPRGFVYTRMNFFQAVHTTLKGCTTLFQARSACLMGPWSSGDHSFAHQ